VPDARHGRRPVRGQAAGPGQVPGRRLAHVRRRVSDAARPPGQRATGPGRHQAAELAHVHRAQAPGHTDDHVGRTLPVARRGRPVRQDVRGHDGGRRRGRGRRRRPAERRRVRVRVVQRSADGRQRCVLQEEVERQNGNGQVWPVVLFVAVRVATRPGPLVFFGRSTPRLQVRVHAHRVYFAVRLYLV